MRYGDTHAVGVRVGREEQVGPHPVAIVEPELKRLAHLGVGVRTGREVPVANALLVDGSDLGDADTLENARHALKADAMKRGVDDAERRAILARGNLERFFEVTV